MKNNILFIIPFLLLFSLSESLSNRENDDFFYREKREVLASFKKFDNPIKYYLKDTIHNDNITIAIERFVNQTCLQFYNVTTESNITDGNGFVFQNASNCGALSGKNESYPRYINISTGCNTPFGIQKLMAIALGMNYEHLRHDRDDYIRVNFTKLKEAGFDKMFNNTMFLNSSKSYGIKYNLGSAFQIQTWLLNDSVSNAFDVLDSAYVDTIGQQSLDFSDYKLLNYYYCNDTCKNGTTTVKPPTCENSGYQDPKGCIKCRCPLLYEGTTCQKLRNSSEQCSSDQYITVTNNTFIRLGEQGNYTCYNRINTTDGQRIEVFLAVVTYDLPNDKFVYRCRPRQSLQVKYYKDKGPMGALFCGPLQSHHIISEGNTVDLRWSGRDNNDGYTMLVRATNATYKNFTSIVE